MLYCYTKICNKQFLKQLKRQKIDARGEAGLLHSPVESTASSAKIRIMSSLKAATEDTTLSDLTVPLPEGSAIARTTIRTERKGTNTSTLIEYRRDKVQYNKGS